jgi:hypothetical protein
MALREGLCYTCAELSQLPFKKDDHYFCSEACLAIYESEMEEEEDKKGLTLG